MQKTRTRITESQSFENFLTSNGVPAIKAKIEKMVFKDFREISGDGF